MSPLAFTTWQFAAAGAVCAAGPLIIHLLNRRRYRVVEWAAMDFLRQAVQRNRRILQIRDLILLAVRTLAVLLFGFALAQPFLAERQEQLDDRQPVHLVLVVDNSLSMAYQSLAGSLLDQAKGRAREIIERVPAGSRISVLAACGTRQPLSSDPYEAKESAVEALGRIEPVDRSADVMLVVNSARRACEAVPQLAKRIVLVTDQQERNWRDLRQTESLKDLPPLQVVTVSAGPTENTWIADVRLQDGLADMETPATVVVAVAHQGSSPRRDLVVKLSVGETVLGEKTLTIEPGAEKREIDFEVTFNTLSQLPEPDKPVFVPLRASLSPDRLAADDERFLAVPVVAALPVVFIDQYGPEEEDVIRGRLGETRQLRRLLAPRTSRGDAPRQLIHVRHLTPLDVTREKLADARLVVIAGLCDPGGLAPLLHEYVEQGGQLLIAAGADFDPAAWNDAASQDSQGILPLPLSREPLGSTPEEAGETLKPFFLSFESLAGENYFDLAGVAKADLEALYAEPFFFKAAQVDASEETLHKLAQAERERLTKSADRNSDENTPQLPAARWLVWAKEGAAESEEGVVTSARNIDDIDATIARRAPHVLARYDLPGKPPFLVSRRIGRGEVLFCSTGLTSSWNTLPKTNAMLVFDRIVRGLIQSTLPRRTIEPTERLALPLPTYEHNLMITLQRPRQQLPQPVDVGYIGPEQRGVILEGLLERGVYRVTATRAAASEAGANQHTIAWDIPLVVGSRSEESDLTPLGRGQFESLAAGTSLRWVAPGEEISLAGAAAGGQNSWWWLALAVLVLLILEMTVAAWPALQPAAAPSHPATLA
jgi:hypothetical protein